MADSNHKSFTPAEYKNPGGDGARDAFDTGFNSPAVTIDHDAPQRPSFLANEQGTGRRQRRNLQHPKTPGYLVLGVRGAILLGLVIFVALLWAFVMGMFYGRGTEFQEKGYRELTNLFYQDQASPKGGQKTSGQAQDQSKTKKDDVLPQLEKDVVGWLADPTPPQQPAPEPKPAPESKPIPKPVVKSVTPSPAPASGFTVQVAATKSEAEAQAAVSDLKAKGFDAYFYSTLVTDKQFFRVRVGNFETREKAIEEISRLDACGYPHGYIARMTEE